MYANIDGAQKQLFAIYGNYNGAQKEFLTMYANIGGTQRVIHQKTYTWAKYQSQRSSEIRYTDPVQVSYVVSFTFDEMKVPISPEPGHPQNDTRGIYYGTSYSYNRQYGTFSLNNRDYVAEIYIDGMGWIGPSWADKSQLVGNYILIDGDPTYVSSITEPSASTNDILRTEYQMVRGIKQYRWDFIFQGYVTSTNPNAYQTSSTASYYDSSSSGSKTAYVFIK